MGLMFFSFKPQITRQAIGKEEMIFQNCNILLRRWMNTCPWAWFIFCYKLIPRTR